MEIKVGKVKLKIQKRDQSKNRNVGRLETEGRLTVHYGEHQGEKLKEKLKEKHQGEKHQGEKHRGEKHRGERQGERQEKHREGILFQFEVY